MYIKKFPNKKFIISSKKNKDNVIYINQDDLQSIDNIKIYLFESPLKLSLTHKNVIDNPGEYEINSVFINGIKDLELPKITYYIDYFQKKIIFIPLLNNLNFLESLPSTFIDLIIINLGDISDYVLKNTNNLLDMIEPKVVLFYTDFDSKQDVIEKLTKLFDSVKVLEDQIFELSDDLQSENNSNYIQKFFIL